MTGPYGGWQATPHHSGVPGRAAVDRAIALDANGAVPCTCSTIALNSRDGIPSSKLLGWHYDACERTIAAVREAPR